MSGRAVLMPAEAVERILAVEDSCDEQGRNFCAACGQMGAGHLYDCPVPELRAALTTPTAPGQDTLKAIADRLRAVADIPITSDTTGQKHDGYILGVGNSTLARLWHCTDDRTHPDEAGHLARGGDLADLYCDSHYPTVDDQAMLAFLLHAKQDIQALLALHGVDVALTAEED